MVLRCVQVLGMRLCNFMTVSRQVYGRFCGQVLDMICKVSGEILKRSWSVSDRFLESFWTCSGKFLGSFRIGSRTVSRTVSWHALDRFWTASMTAS